MNAALNAALNTSLHHRARLLDLHADPILQNRLFGYDLTVRHSPGVRGQPFFWHTDIPRMIEAGYLGACLGIHFWPINCEAAWREMNRQLDIVDEIAEKTESCMRIRRASDWKQVQQSGKLGLAVGVEGAHMLNGRLERVPVLADRGVSYLTLAHFVGNQAVSPSMGLGANNTKGLTPWGRDLVAALNDCGVTVDVAHVNRPGVLDVCAVTRAPLLCTHTGAYTLHGTPRNLHDEEIDAIAATGGSIGVIFGPLFLAGSLWRSSEVVLDHIEYIADRVGVQHVSIGTDYDGWMPAIPCDQRDCRDTVKITQGLLGRGWSEADVRLVLHENAMRVFRAQKV